MEYKEDIRYYYIHMKKSGLFITASTFGISKESFINHFPNIFEDENICDDLVFKLNIYFNRNIK